jgi:Tfp pilus assembly protein PilX
MKRHHGLANKARGFALVVTLSLMVLLTIIAVGLLSLSAISLRGTTQANAHSLALMLAIGDLQKEMGPDMRISAESALFDSSTDSEKIDGVA